jgi:hypothetical protein
LCVLDSGGSLCVSLRNYVSPNIGCLKKIVHKNLKNISFTIPYEQRD